MKTLLVASVVVAGMLAGTANADPGFSVGALDGSIGALVGD